MTDPTKAIDHVGILTAKLERATRELEDARRELENVFDIIRCLCDDNGGEVRISQSRLIMTDRRVPLHAYHTFPEGDLIFSTRPRPQ